MFKVLLSDRLLVRLDPLPEMTGSLILPRPRTVRTGVVLQVGPGRYVKTRRPGATLSPVASPAEYREVLRPTQAQKGERVAFLVGSVDTKTGQAVTHYLQEDERVIREDDVLFVIPDGVDVEVTQ
jgi:hypothetical protein